MGIWPAGAVASTRALEAGQTSTAAVAATTTSGLSGFTLSPGAAIDVGVGANGSVWAIGVNTEFGGFGIWRWNGTVWDPVPGGAVTIAVDPGGNPWVTNSFDQIYHWNGHGWNMYPGRGSHIAVGANGALWVIGTNREPGGFGIWHWNGHAWGAVPGGAVTIGVDPAGNPWVTNSVGQILHWNGRGWGLYPGGGSNIAVGADGALWVIGVSPERGGFGVWHWTGSSWVTVPGGGVRLAVDASGNPWVVNSSHQVFSYRPLPSLTSCADPVWTTSDPEGTDPIYTAGSDPNWWVNNDAWNGGHGPQSMYMCNQSSWYATSDQPNIGGAVETYPDTEYDIGGRDASSTKPISAYNSITSTFSEQFPTTGDCMDASYDTWLNNWGIEVMIWNEDAGAQAYWNTAGTPITVDGVNYEFVSSGAGGTYFAFIMQNQEKSGTVNILAVYQYLVSQGLVASTAVPTQLEYGTEICGTTGSQTFPMTGLTFNLS